MLADSNIWICASKPGEQWARDFVAAHAPVLSAVSVVEVLGYPRIDPADDHFLRSLIAVATVYPVSMDIIWQAVALRQARRLKLGDALIAATALVHMEMLATRNTADFAGVPGLTVFDPFTGS